MSGQRHVRCVIALDVEKQSDNEFAKSKQDWEWDVYNQLEEEKDESNEDKWR